MFSFLSPVALWLTALLAIPLAIHFLGRERLKKVPFPSLLLVRGELAHTMHRHRIKNWLLLILRTLLLLCLLLALWNPVLRGSGLFPTPGARAAVLLHDGIYGEIPLDSGGLLRDHQARRIALLDSLHKREIRVERVIGAEEPEERYGDLAAAAAGLLHRLSPDPSVPQQVHFPVFSASDAVTIMRLLNRHLENNPGLRVVIVDYSPLAPLATAVVGADVAPPGAMPLVELKLELGPRINLAGGETRLRQFRDGRLIQESPVLERRPIIHLEAGTGGYLAGTVELEARPRHARQTFHYNVPDPGRLVMGHSGATLSSLAGLGAGDAFRQVRHFPDPAELLAGLRGDGATPEGYSLVYLSNAPVSHASLYRNLREHVRQGGLAVVGLGDRTDLALLNRHLLQPLEAGRVGEPEAGNPGPVRLHPSRFLGERSLDSLLSPEVRISRWFSFAPAPRSEILLSAGGKPLLVHSAHGSGQLLLWLTDIDDVQWTDLGIHPVAPLLHQAFQMEHRGDAWRNLAVHSDSVATLEVGEDFFPPRVLDPSGREFTRVKAAPGALRIGPFPSLGHYRILGRKDTLSLAVNLAGRGSAPPIPWEDILEGLGDKAPRVRVMPFDGSLEQLKGGYQPLWRGLVLAAILLLFLEGAACAYMGGRRNRASNPSV